MRDMDKVFVLSLDTIPSLDELLHKMKVAPNGFGAVIVQYIYDNLFATSIDLKEEYKKYYSVEYSNFESFVVNKVGMNIDSSQLYKEHVLLIDWFMSLIDSRFEDNYLDLVLKTIRS